MQIIIYALIVLLLVLLGVAGLQFTYMFYVDWLNRERNKYLRDLERNARDLRTKLEAAQAKIAEQQALLEQYVPEYLVDDDAWSDIIEER
ncbi:MAG: hypothetical protein ABJA02_05180 [Acidobacteriota bacterium]